MVLAKENNVFKTVATGSGLFKCTKAYYDAHKNDIPNNTAILITDDAAGGDYVTEDEAQDMIDTSLTPVDITSNITWDTSKFTVFSSETRAWKIGRLVVCLLKGTLLSSEGYNTIGTGLPQPVSSNNVANFTFVTNDGSTGTKSGCGYINNSRNICVRFADGAGEFAANFSYIAKE